MLDGDIQIFYNFVVSCNFLYQLIVKLIHIEVVEPDPLNTIYFGKLTAKLRQTSSAIYVGAVAGDILGDDN